MEIKKVTARGIILVAVLFLSMHLCAQTLSEHIGFEERVFSFGTIYEKDGKVSHTFVFKNKGRDPAVINDIYSGCGCIGKVISDKAVQPGALGKVTITFNPEYKSGFFSKEIVVFSNNGKEFNRIWVEGDIVAAEHPVEESYPYNFGDGLYLRLKVMAFGYMKPGETRQMDLHYANNTNESMSLRLVSKDSAALRFRNPGKIAPKGKGVISISYTMPFTFSNALLIPVYPYVNSRRANEILFVKILNDQMMSKDQPSKTKRWFEF